ncbi:hypothetical protein [Streptomyces prasinus]|uniref:hypothetical protein n=1 Tax=Streptomyces prasinus TaxID=67345 RepID=UPI0036A78BC0
MSALSLRMRDAFSERFDRYREPVGCNCPPSVVSSEETDGFRASAIHLDLGITQVGVLEYPSLRACRESARRFDLGFAGVEEAGDVFPCAESTRDHPTAEARRPATVLDPRPVQAVKP